MTFDRYVGLPFEERGRGPNGFDCWGLLHLVYREQLGIDLPSFSDQYVTTQDADHLAALIADNRDELWEEIPAGSERVGDGVLMNLQGQPRHVGIVVGSDRILHIERASGSIIERASSPRLKSRIVGFFRYIGHEPQSPSNQPTGVGSTLS